MGLQARGCSVTARVLAMMDFNAANSPRYVNKVFSGKNGHNPIRKSPSSTWPQRHRTRPSASLSINRAINTLRNTRATIPEVLRAKIMTHPRTRPSRHRKTIRTSKPTPTSNSKPTPTSNKLTPTSSNKQTPTSNKQTPTSNKQIPTSNKQIPTNSKQTPTNSSKQTPISNSKQTKRIKARAQLATTPCPLAQMTLPHSLWTMLLPQAVRLPALHLEVWDLDVGNSEVHNWCSCSCA